MKGQPVTRKQAKAPKRPKPRRSAKEKATPATVPAVADPTPPNPTKQHVVDIEASLKGELQSIGGSKSDDWNNLVANQAMQTIWAGNDPKQASDRTDGVITALICISPKDEFEGMLAAQMLGAHNAAMECYRRAMLPEQPFIGRSEALSQANKLSRTYATLLEALNRHRGKGQQKVTVEHVHVHAGGQAMVGLVERPGGGGREKNEV